MATGTVTISGTSYDIYGTKVLATEYMRARIGADAWNTASSGDKDKALVSSTRWLDRQNWQGQKTVVSQPLEFPRTGLTDKDGNAVASDIPPVLVEEAGYEMALEILADASVQSNITTGSNTKRVRAGSAEVEFFRATGGTKLPSIAQEMAGVFLDGGARSTGCAKGTDGVSTFTDLDQWGRTRGFP